MALVEVVDPGGERADIDAAVVDPDVLVQKREGDPLAAALLVELPLAGAGEAGVEKVRDVLALGSQSVHDFL